MANCIDGQGSLGIDNTLLLKPMHAESLPIKNKNVVEHGDLFQVCLFWKESSTKDTPVKERGGGGGHRKERWEGLRLSLQH